MKTVEKNMINRLAVWRESNTQLIRIPEKMERKNCFKTRKCLRMKTQFIDLKMDQLVPNKKNGKKIH